MPNFSNILDPMRTWWEGATAPTRAAAIGLSVLVFAGLILAAVLAASPDYTPIFHGVPGKDAATIETALREKNIPMQFDDKDGTVSVPSKDESEATMTIEAAGILSKDKDADDVTVDGLPQISPMADHDVEEQQLLQANEAALARKLRGLDPVNTAAVTIAPGSTTSLVGSDVAPTASVILGLKQNEMLSNEQINGIVHLVADAYTGLTLQNVTIVDQSGTLLWKPNAAGQNTAGSGQPLDQNAGYAERVRQQLQGMLDTAFGIRNTVVVVNAELNQDQIHTEQTEYTPAPGMRNGLPVSKSEQTEKLTGSPGAGVGGPAGTASNLPGPTSYGSGGSGNSGGYDNSKSLINYDNNKKITIQDQTPGDKVEQISVAAMVNNSVPTDSIPKIQMLLAGAIHANPGDTTKTVTVQQFAFDTSGQKAEAAQIKDIASQQLWANITKVGMVSVIGCILLFLLTRSGGRRMVSAPQLALAGGGANIGLLEGASDQELENMLEERPLRIEDVLAEMPEVDPQKNRRRRTHAPSIEEQQDLKLESIQEMIGGHPESVALLMKGWMAD